jgi:hypothetical protein
MQTPMLAKLIGDCWTTAENAVRKAIHEKHHDVGEEFITTFLRGELRWALKDASDNRRVEKAFLDDLRKAFPGYEEERTLTSIPGEPLSTVARGLIATLSFHPKHVEGKTGGDLGIAVARPDVELNSRMLRIHQRRRRGLLCQAKIFERNSRWGPLTCKQKEAFPRTADYSALLLYRYDDQEAQLRRELRPFSWKLTRNATVNTIKSWLKQDCFDQLLHSGQIFQGLMTDRIGTGDKERIDTDVAPPLHESLASLVITIDWKDGRGPGPWVAVTSRSAVLQERQRMRVRK